MSDGLYREEAIEQASAKHLGEPQLDSATGFLKLTVLLVAALITVISLLGSSTYTRKHEVNGRLDETNATAVIAVDFGNLKHLDVREGDVVRKGDLLGRISSLKGNQQELLSELRQQLQHWEHIIKRTKDEQVAKLRDFDRGKQQINRVLWLTRQDIQLQEDKVEQLREQLKQTTSLRDRGYLSNLDWLSFQTNLIAEQQSLNRQKKLFVELIGERDGVDESRRVYNHEYAQQHSELSLNVSDARTRLSEMEQRQSQPLMASISGRVTRIEKPAGSSLSPGQPVLYLSASEENYSGTLIIPSHVAGHVNVGQTLALELDSYPAETYGRIRAEVTQLSSHTVSDQNQPPAFIARLDVQPHKKIKRLMPGMRFTTYVEVNSDTLFRWVLKPLIKLTETIR